MGATMTDDQFGQILNALERIAALIELHAEITTEHLAVVVEGVRSSAQGAPTAEFLRLCGMKQAIPDDAPPRVDIPVRQ